MTLAAYWIKAALLWLPILLLGYLAYLCFRWCFRWWKPKSPPEPTDFASEAAPVCFLTGLYALHLWARIAHLPPPGWLLWLGMLMSAYYGHLFFHEAGHAIAGWLVGFRLVDFKAGPLRWWRDRVGGHVGLDLSDPLGGYVVALPPASPTSRLRKALFVAGGPVASLLLAGVTAALAETVAPAPAWYFVGLTSVVSLSLLLSALHTSEATDFLLLRRLWQGGPWLDYFAVREMAGRSLYGGDRPRDWDADRLYRAVELPVAPHDCAKLLLGAFRLHCDRGEPTPAFACLDRAEKLVSQHLHIAEDLDAFPMIFARLEAFHRFDAARARHWLDQAKAPARPSNNFDWILAQTAGGFIDEDWPRALQHLEAARRLTAHLPHCGYFDLERDTLTLYQQLIEDARNRAMAPAA